MTPYIIDGQEYTINRVDVIAASSALTTVVAGATGYKHRVIAFELQADSSTCSITWQSNATAIANVMSIASTSITASPSVPFWFETASGEALKINNATALRTAYGQVWFVTY